MKKGVFSIVLFVTVLLSFCGTEKVDHVVSELSLYSKQHFDGIKIGETMQVIIEATIDSVELDGDNIVLTRPFDSDKILKRVVHVTTDEGMAYEITVDTYLSHDSLVGPYFFKCKEKLEEIYGASDVDNGYATWQSPSINKKVIEIELFDESIDHDIAMVSVNFFEDHDKSFYAE